MMEAKDFSSDRQVKYCAGCGNYGILMAMKKTFAELELNPKDIAVISGIGCSSRTPYYLNTWGFNTIHGRAGAIASGLKIARPDLSVWQCTGDGDCLAIGGNHFIHEVRRNIDINIIIFNNEIYGLTKGQYSPTTPQGQVTKTSPYGTIEEPLNVGDLTLASKGTFFARCLDVELKKNVEIFKQAYNHKGTSVIECLTNCIVWNDGAHKNIEYITIKDGDKFEIEGVEFTRDIHCKMQAKMVLEYFNGKDHPLIMGVIYQENRPTYEDVLYRQIK